MFFALSPVKEECDCPSCVPRVVTPDAWPLWTAVAIPVGVFFLFVVVSWL